jgi:hypothetical protein
VHRCGSANSAMFAEIVPEQLRSVVYAFDRSFEGAIAACAAPLVGEAPSLPSIPALLAIKVKRVQAPYVGNAHFLTCEHC